jgi:hypothetical protein
VCKNKKEYQCFSDAHSSHQSSHSFETIITKTKAVTTITITTTTKTIRKMRANTRTTTVQSSK